MLMHQLLEDGANRHPDKLAFRWVDRDKTLTFSEAAAAMERYAGALHHLGVRKGDRVTIFAHNGMDYLLGLFACWRIGAIAALVNIRFADELDYYFADHEPSVVIYTHDMLEPVRLAAAKSKSVRALVCMDGPQPGAESLPDLLAASFAPPPDPRDEDAIAHLSYTSGTTGKPKGACLAHEPTMRAANCIAERLRITSDDVSFGPTALSSSYQLVGNLLPPLHRGATVNVMGRWTQAERLRRARAHAGDDPGRQPDAAQRTADRSAQPRPHARQAAADGVGRRAGAADAEAGPARRMADAARRKLRPERARRLHGARAIRCWCRRRSSAPPAGRCPTRRCASSMPTASNARSATSAKCACAAAT